MLCIQTAWHESPSSYLLHNKATRHVGPRHPVSALGKNFLLPLSPCSLATLSFYSPSMASYNNTNCCILSLNSSHNQETQRNSSWTECICRGICWQAYLWPRYAPGWGQEVGGRHVFCSLFMCWDFKTPGRALLLFYYLDTGRRSHRWFMLPVSRFPSPLGLISTSPKILGKRTLPAMGTWGTLAWCCVHNPHYCQNSELLMTNFSKIWETCMKKLS